MATIIGTADWDDLSGTESADTIDTLAGDGDDLVYGDDGNDGNDQIDGGAGNDTLFGGSSDDTIFDSLGVNVLDGGDGNNLLVDSSTDPGQTVCGGAGDDTISVVTGATLTGAEGSDTYRFLAGDNLVTDFTAGAGGDVIDVAYLQAFMVDNGGDNPFDTGHLRLVQEGADALLQEDSDGPSGGAGWLTLATLRSAIWWRRTSRALIRRPARSRVRP